MYVIENRHTFNDIKKSTNFLISKLKKIQIKENENTAISVKIYVKKTPVKNTNKEIYITILYLFEIIYWICIRVIFNSFWNELKEWITISSFFDFSL